MSDSKYLNGVLTVIAVCLVILTLSVIGVFPKANAATTTKSINVPVNPDGSINVRLGNQSEMRVDIVRVGGANIEHVGDDSSKPMYLPVHDVKR
jgi:hypothetical protein